MGAIAHIHIGADAQASNDELFSDIVSKRLSAEAEWEIRSAHTGGPHRGAGVPNVDGLAQDSAVDLASKFKEMFSAPTKSLHETNEVAKESQQRGKDTLKPQRNTPALVEIASPSATASSDAPPLVSVKKGAVD